MTDVRISYIMPTIGRTTAPGLIEKVSTLLGDRDELIVIGDGEQRAIREFVHKRQYPRTHYLQYSDPISAYGNAQRDFGMRTAVGNWLMFIDDDDDTPLTTLDDVRAEIAGGSTPVVFSARIYERMYAKSLEIHEVGIIQLAVPAPTKCRFNTRPEVPGTSDNIFIKGVVAEFGGVRYSDIVIAEAKEFGRGLWK